MCWQNFGGVLGFNLVVAVRRGKKSAMSSRSTAHSNERFGGVPSVFRFVGPFHRMTQHGWRWGELYGRSRVQMMLMVRVLLKRGFFRMASGGE